ncbi:tyrosine-type recombinase/integrase [Streptomyces violaceusniger]|uniref:tyrosine-type recombinase/integrase n=1 Tax=Streptomyces violaceusniger TaxID=68280 RepID=UPI0036829C3F
MFDSKDIALDLRTPCAQVLPYRRSQGGAMSNVTARQCAARWGIGDAAARRILAPLKPIARDTETGAMLYDQAEADAAHNSRPGRGTRNDKTASPMPDEQFEQLVNDDSIPAEHRALWTLLRDGHARIVDALSLDVRDVDLDRREARISYPKKEHEPRSIPLTERTTDLLRQIKGDREDGPLITGAHDRPLSRETAARFARQAGADSIHAFRPRPHQLGTTPRFGAAKVAAREVRVGDTLYWDGREIPVSSVKSVTAPSGAVDVQINLGSDFPIFAAAEEPITIAERQEAE